MDKNKISVVNESKSSALTVLLLAWPIFIEQILVSLAGYINTAMVGSLGKTATAAVSISNAPMMLVNGVIMALGVGFTALVSRSVGAGDIEHAKKIMRQALTAVIMIGVPLSLIFFALGRSIPVWMGGATEILDDAAIYNRIIGLTLSFRALSIVLTALYRGFSDTKTPMIVNIGMNIINVVGNFFLIFPTRPINILGSEFIFAGAGLGVAGAATSTAISYVVGAVALVLITFIRKNHIQLSVKGDYRPDWGVLKTVSRISIPAAFERILTSSASIVSTSTIAILGTTAVASHSLALTAESMSFMPGFAMGAAATTLVGQSLGAKRPDLAQKYIKSTSIIASIIMLVFSLILFIFATPIIGIFTPDADVIALGTRCLQITALIQIPQVIAMVLSGGMRGAGDTKWTFIIMSSSMWFVRMPITIVTIRLLGFGLEAAYVAMCADICARCAGFYLRYRTGKWKSIRL